jgi:hypothetical protein
MSTATATAARARPAEATYDVSRKDRHWRVAFGRFTWEFDTWPAACEHALECARLYATVSGRCTNVRVPASNGDMLEIRRYAGVIKLPTACRRLRDLGERRA